jgi:hypothetical protein
VNQEREQNAPLANVGDPVANLCARAEALCRRIAPRDLAGLPLYIVPQSALAAEFGNAEATYGYTMSWLDWVLRDQIGDAWQGRGPCIVVNDIAMREDLGRFIEPTFLATAIHELAHVFERDMRFDAVPDLCANRVIFERLRLAHDVREPVPESEQARTFHQHDQRFIRAMLHLRFRAERCGAALARAVLAHYGPAILARPIDYELALQNEPERKLDASIRDILASPPPPAFSRLWDEEMEFLTRHFLCSKETK